MFSFSFTISTTLNTHLDEVVEIWMYKGTARIIRKNIRELSFSALTFKGFLEVRRKLRRINNKKYIIKAWGIEFLRLSFFSTKPKSTQSSFDGIDKKRYKLNNLWICTQFRGNLIQKIPIKRKIPSIRYTDMLPGAIWSLLRFNSSYQTSISWSFVQMNRVTLDLCCFLDQFL